MSGRPLELSAPELRVLGCLIEKQRTTPDAYPLTLNSLRLACNQSTNRDPVVDYDEATVRAALERLSRRRLVRLTSGAGSRAAKHRHLVDQALTLEGSQLALLCLLLLRGPQTPGELKARGERLHPFTGLPEVQQVLSALVDRGFAARHARRPGQNEERYSHLLGEDEPVADPDAVRSGEHDSETSATDGGRAEAADTLAHRVASLEREVAQLWEALGGR